MTNSPFMVPVRARRNERQLTQTELARLAGVSRVTVTRIERGQGVHSDSLLAVVSALDLAIKLGPVPPSA
jgi:DNA-binding XRE family transcriptional regulator